MSKVADEQPRKLSLEMPDDSIYVAAKMMKYVSSVYKYSNHDVQIIRLCLQIMIH